MRVEFNLDTGFAGANHKEVLDLPDDYSEDDIEDVYQDWTNNFLGKYWIILEDSDECNS